MTDVLQEPTQVALPLAKLFSDLDNQDCLDFSAGRNKNLR